MRVRHTTEEIREKIKLRYNDEFELLSEYKTIDDPIVVRHKNCGYVWSPIAYNFLKGKGCRKCMQKRLNDSKRKTQEEFERQVKEKYQDQFTVLGEYKTTHTPIKMRHNYFYARNGKKIVCNQTVMIPDPISFLTRIGRRSICPACKYKQKMKIGKRNVKLNSLFLFCVYKHVNRVNKKVYIGITSDSFFKRWMHGKGYIENDYFYNSILKYGWPSFSHFILRNGKWIKVEEMENRMKEYQYSFKEACDLEKKYIHYYKNKLGVDKVYNMTCGGEGLIYIRTKKVLQYDLNCNLIAKYESLKEASLKTGIKDGVICACCNGTIKTAGRFLWKYEDSDKKIVAPLKVANRNVKVLQYDLKGNYLNTYNSIADASRKTKTIENGIYRCCHDKQKKSGNYQWKFITSNKKIKEVSIYATKVREVLQYDLKGNFIAKYNTLTEAIKKLSNYSIGYSCRNKCITACGYIWIYNDKEKEKNLKWHLEKLKTKGRKKGKKTYCYNLKGELLKVFSSAHEAEEYLNIRYDFIQNVCKGRRLSCRGYIFLNEKEDYKKEIEKRIVQLKKAHVIK